MHRQIKNHLELFFSTRLRHSEFSKLQQRTLLDAFDRASRFYASEDLLEHLHTRKLTILPAGWDGHAIDLVFYDKYMAVCNRGEGVLSKYGTVAAFKIDPSRITKELIDRISQQDEVICAAATRFFYNTLPGLLSEEAEIQDAVCLALKNTQPKQVSKGGICSLSCGKAAFRCAGSLMKIIDGNLEPKNHQNALQRVRTETKAWALFLRINTLQAYLDSFFLESKKTPRSDGISPDLTLARKAWKVIRGKFSRTGPWIEPLLPSYRQLAGAHSSILAPSAQDLHRKTRE